MERIKIIRINGLMYIYINLWSLKENKYRNMFIMIDTGASITTISEFILSGLGYSNKGNDIMVTTASGTIKVQSKYIFKIKIGSTELKNVEVYAHNFPDECFSDGVLGMNILEQFNLTINFDEDNISLDKRKEKIYD
jgi:clan AA aspartic protease (TIGR02281 family)